jgi:ABC-type uncharacterized transport system substrate-binding protein
MLLPSVASAHPHICISAYLPLRLCDKIQVLPMNQLQYAFDNYFIDENSLYFNNLVQTKEELENKWIIPVRDSWIARRVVLNSHA